MWPTAERLEDSVQVWGVTEAAITFGLYPPLPFPRRPEPRAVPLYFLFQLLLQTGLCALEQTDTEMILKKISSTCLL